MLNVIKLNQSMELDSLLTIWWSIYTVQLLITGGDEGNGQATMAQY
jgi:hypothetical protein